MIPTQRTFVLLSLWAGIALLAALQPSLQAEGDNTLSLLWAALTIVLGVALVTDLLRSRKGIIHGERQLPGSFSIGSRQTVRLALHNYSDYHAHIDVYDHVPQHFRLHHTLPFQLPIKADQHCQLSYDVTATERGETHFPQIEIRYSSRWGLWKLRQRIHQQQTARVYPNFLSIAHLEGLHDQEQERELGLHQVQRLGEGIEFLQLRDFVQGDSLRHVDWKATARRRKLISREYQDERDQEVMFLLDCGRRMRNKDDALSHFDHALNAMLLSAYVALKHGDAVGMMNFASNQQRHFKPIKGQGNLNALLNYTYDLQSTLHSADYLNIATAAAGVQKKRSLIIIITNASEDDQEDLLRGVKLLKERHLVMVANLRDRTVDENITKPIEAFDDALLYSGSIAHLQRRKQLLQQLEKSGIQVVDTTPQQLHTSLIQKYLQLKRSGLF